jgi:hypothetical protein
MINKIVKKSKMEIYSASFRKGRQYNLLNRAEVIKQGRWLFISHCLSGVQKQYSTHRFFQNFRFRSDFRKKFRNFSLQRNIMGLVIKNKILFLPHSDRHAGFRCLTCGVKTTSALMIKCYLGCKLNPWQKDAEPDDFRRYRVTNGPGPDDEEETTKEEFNEDDSLIMSDVPPANITFKSPQPVRYRSVSSSATTLASVRTRTPVSGINKTVMLEINQKLAEQGVKDALSSAKGPTSSASNNQKVRSDDRNKRWVKFWISPDVESDGEHNNMHKLYYEFDPSELIENGDWAARARRLVEIQTPLQEYMRIKGLSLDPDRQVSWNKGSSPSNSKKPLPPGIIDTSKWNTMADMLAEFPGPHAEIWIMVPLRSIEDDTVIKDELEDHPKSKVKKSKVSNSKRRIKREPEDHRLSGKRIKREPEDHPLSGKSAPVIKRELTLGSRSNIDKSPIELDLVDDVFASEEETRGDDWFQDITNGLFFNDDNEFPIQESEEKTAEETPDDSYQKEDNSSAFPVVRRSARKHCPTEKFKKDGSGRFAKNL